MTEQRALYFHCKSIRTMAAYRSEQRATKHLRIWVGELVRIKEMKESDNGGRAFFERPEVIIRKTPREMKTYTR